MNDIVVRIDALFMLNRKNASDSIGSIFEFFALEK